MKTPSELGAQTETLGHEDRRRTYRVDPSRKYGLQTTIVYDGIEMPVSVVDLSLIGAGIHTGSGTRLMPGTEITVRFSTRHMAHPTITRATVRACRPEPGGILRYGIEFNDPKTLQARLPRNLLGAFNARRSFRVSPAEPVTAMLCRRDDSLTIQARLINISATGCALSTTREGIVHLMVGDEVRLGFRLTGVETGFRLIGHVRNKILTESYIRYGVEFAPDECRQWLRQQSAIEAYVMDRQRRS